jgi:hypothetical protein
VLVFATLMSNFASGSQFFGQCIAFIITKNFTNISFSSSGIGQGKCWCRIYVAFPGLFWLCIMLGYTNGFVGAEVSSWH